MLVQNQHINQINEEIMRTIETYQIDLANDALTIIAEDEHDACGVEHVYTITGFHAPPCDIDPHGVYDESVSIRFQNGNPGEVGVNGITDESLLAILIDRLEAFQAGPNADQYYALALECLKVTQYWLNERTRDHRDGWHEGSRAK